MAVDRDDKYYLERIIEHSKRIEDFTKRFNGNLEKLENDLAYQQAVILSIVQLGENVRKLSEDVKVKNPQVIWREVSDMRNLLVHDYEGTDCSILWDVIENDIPKLKSYCKKILQEI